MIDEPQDVTHRTTGRMTFQGTATFHAEREQYGSASYRYRADDEEHALVVLEELSEESIYADSRIDYLRRFEVEEDDECEIDDEQTTA